MTEKNRAIRAHQRAAARAAQTRQRWIIAVAIAVVVIGAGVLIYLTTLKPAATSPSQSSSAPTISAKQYAAAPAMQIDPKKQYLATVKMAKGGEFVIQLYPDKAPDHGQQLCLPGARGLL